MTSEKLLMKYIQSSEKAITEMKLTINSVALDEAKIKKIIDTARRYLDDAKYYRSIKRLETGLVSIAYCEGLLDALRLLGMVEFTW